jgi:eukaryotic-like serine/threonine-protein kinase
MELQDANAPQARTGLPPTIPDHELLQPIGRGGYGSVWLARNRLGVYRAVKIVYRGSFTDHRPFEREWSGIRRFEPISRSHEGFVDVLHVGINEPEGYFYYVMELGDDLASGQTIDPANYAPRTLRQEIALRGQLAASECLKLGLALSQALDELHGAGLVHRDIKPSNIIFVHGIPKLADIGLVADVNEARSFVGTEGYIPPEGPGTPQADLYGLGKALYEASTGNDRKQFPDLPALVDQLPEREKFLELNEVLLRACHPQASSRYATARDMHAELLVLVNGKSVKRLRLLERRFARLERLVVISLVVAALLGTAGYAIYHQRKAASDARQRAAGASVAYGIQAMNAGDFLGALPHFTDALQLESGDPPRARAEHLRIGSVLDQCPKLTHFWSGSGPLVGGQFSPDGTRVLLARFHSTAEVYDLQHSSPRLLKPPPTLIDAAYSPDRRLLVTTSQSSVACIWDVASFKEIRRLPHPCQLWSARFSPDGLRLVTAASDGMARVWDVQSGALSSVLKHADAVHFADFSHDGKLIVTASHDGTARLWDPEHGQPAGAPLNHGAWVTHAAFSPDDRKLVTGCLDRKARVWETATGRRLLPDLNHRDSVQSVEFSPDGRLILTAGKDGTARLWLTENQQPADIDPILQHPGPLTRASFSPDSRQILTTCSDGSARIWDLAGSAARPVAAHGFSADGSRFLMVASNRVQVCDTASGQILWPPPLSQSTLRHAALSRDGRFLVTVSASGPAGTNHLVQVWDVAAGRALGPGLRFSNAPAGVSLTAHGERVVAFEGKRVQTWNVLTGSPFSPILTCRQPVGQCFFSRTGDRVVTLSGDEVRVWDARTGRAVFAPLTHSQPVEVAQFSPDDRFLAVGCSDPRLTTCYAQVYSATTGHPTGARLDHGAAVLCLAFSPDGRRLVTASADFTAVVWDAATGRRLAGPLQHPNRVRHAAFSPDGRWVVTVCADQGARVWDAASGEPLTPPLRSPSPLARAAFLADQRHIVLVDETGSGQVRKLPVEPRSRATLLSLVRLLSGGSSPGDAGAPTEPPETLWQRLRIEYPGDFATSMEDIAAWHELAAHDSEVKLQRTAVAFHLEHLLSLRPSDPAVAKNLARAQEHLPHTK